MPQAARIMCSSSARFILLEHRKAGLGREDAAEWAGLAQTSRFLVGAGQEFQNLLQGPMVEDLAPFEEDGWNRGLPLLNPPLQGGFGALEQFRLRSQSLGDGPIQRKAALVDPGVRSRTPWPLWMNRRHNVANHLSRDSKEWPAICEPAPGPLRIKASKKT